MTDLLPLGTMTVYGIIQAIHSSGGERSYFILKKDGKVTLMPADLLHKEDVLSEPH